MYYTELRNSKKRYGKINMVPLNEINNHIGFRGVYAYDEEQIKNIIENNSTANLHTIPCYSNLLCIDFDDNPNAANIFERILSDISYHKFYSGGRSIHFEVQIDPMYGINVPLEQKLWMKKNCTGHDGSIYHKAGMWRLEGTWHEKNLGNKKVLLYKQEGIPLHIEIDLTKEINCDIFRTRGEFQMNLDNLLFTFAEVGNRRPHLFKIIRTCREDGIDDDSIYSICRTWNEIMTYEPLTTHELDKFIKGVIG